MMGAVGRGRPGRRRPHGRRDPAAPGRAGGRRRRRRTSWSWSTPCASARPRWTGGPTRSWCCPAGSARWRSSSRSGPPPPSACTPSRWSCSTRTGSTTPLWAWLADLEKRGFVRREALDTLLLARTVDDALDRRRDRPRCPRRVPPGRLSGAGGRGTAAQARPRRATAGGRVPRIEATMSSDLPGRGHVVRAEHPGAEPGRRPRSRPACPSSRSSGGRSRVSPTKSLLDSDTSTGQPVATSSPSRRVSSSECQVFLPKSCAGSIRIAVRPHPGRDRPLGQPGHGRDHVGDHVVVRDPVRPGARRQPAGVRADQPGAVLARRPRPAPGRPRPRRR